MIRRVVLVKHAQPVVDPSTPPREWRLGPEGEGQARRLATRLEEFAPFDLATSREPKAVETAGIVAAAFALRARVIEGLEEFDRPALPLMPPLERERMNARIFESPTEVVLGRESGAQALARFRGGLARALEPVKDKDTLVVITHGTVITLLVAAHNPIEPLAFWSGLGCTSRVVLTPPDLRLERVEGEADRASAS